MYEVPKDFSNSGDASGIAFRGSERKAWSDQHHPRFWPWPKITLILRGKPFSLLRFFWASKRNEEKQWRTAASGEQIADIDTMGCGGSHFWLESLAAQRLKY
jgi:hypothetical protein